MTEIQFGLHSAGRERLARYGGQEMVNVSENSIILDLHQPHARRPYRLSAIEYRVSAIAYRLSAIQNSAAWLPEGALSAL